MSYQNRFFAKARPDCDFRYFSNCLAQSIFLKAKHIINSQDLSLGMNRTARIMGLQALFHICSITNIGCVWKIYRTNQIYVKHIKQDELGPARLRFQLHRAVFAS